MAVAHTMLTIAYHMLKNTRSYADLGGTYLEQINKDQLQRYFVKRLQRSNPRSSPPELMNILARALTTLILVASLSSLSLAQTRATYLHVFTGPPSDGQSPYAALATDGSGNFYRGGAYEAGTVFKVVPNTLSETIIYSFGATPTDGEYPFGSLVLDRSGNIYGTTTAVALTATGPSSGSMLPATSRSSIASRVAPTEATPGGNMARDAAGNFYGGAHDGGNQACEFGCGTVFDISPSGVFTLVYAFSDPSLGYNPGLLVRDPASGTLYGATLYGGDTSGDCNGAFGRGAIFEIDSTGAYSMLHAFTGGLDGGYGPAITTLYDGNLYGMTEAGGTSNDGVIFELSTATGVETVLYNFDGSDGLGPTGGVIRDAVGNLYGTALGGGKYNLGTSFKLDTLGVLHTHNFPGGKGGNSPWAGLIRGGAGKFYGTTLYGGSKDCTSPAVGCGTVFSVQF
jgi:uncharacterized repeat protein (TIGR03803 family)